jgi:uncharacterized protein
MTQLTFENWRDLAKLDYFELLDDGRLALTVDGLDGLVDFHTHLGFTFLIARPVDLTVRNELRHNFEPDLPVNLDLYSGEDFHNVRPKWANEDYVPCVLSVTGRGGKHATHTLPNILWEMDALKIENSVSLCLDITNSKNSKRTAEVLANQSRVIFYCSVHPKDKHAEKKMRDYLAAGALGMKVHAEIQRTPVDDPAMVALVKLWKEVSGGLPVLFHSGYNGFEPAKVREHAAIEKFLPAIEALEGSPCVLGHTAMNQYRIASEIAAKNPHVYLEIGGQPPRHLLEIMDITGDDRLLLGSDWPVYPQAIPIAKVLIATEGNPQTRIKILRDNARRLLAESKAKAAGGK